jgi:hypothetical protein
LIDEVVDRQAGSGLGTGEQIAHVVADARNPDEAGLLVKQLLHV